MSHSPSGTPTAVFGTLRKKCRLRSRRPFPSWWGGVLVAATAVAVYANTFGLGLVWDDILLILRPSPIQSLSNIGRFFGSGVSSGLGVKEAMPYYRPLFSLSMSLDYALWGKNPLGYHAVNVLLHALTCLLVYAGGLRLSRSRAGGLFAGLLFATHPVHAEAVAYVAARNELLCGLFLTASLVSYLVYSRRGRPLWMLISLAAFALSLLSKEMAATFPAAILVYEAVVARGGIRRSLLRTLPFAAFVALYLLVRRAILVAPALFLPPLAVRLYTSPGVVLEYLGLLVAPVRLKVLHDVPLRWSVTEPGVYLPLAGLAVVAAMLVYAFKADKRAFFAASWTVIALAPVSGLPAFIEPSLLADRYLYIPSIGYALLAGAIVGRLWCRSNRSMAGKKWSGRIGLAALALLLVIFAGMTLARNPLWGDAYSFYQRMISDAPQHPLGPYVMGNWLGKQGRTREMARAYQESLALTLPRQNALAAGYVGIGEYQRAEKELEHLLNIGLWDAKTFNTLGMVHRGFGRLPQAEQAFQQALSLEPSSREIRANLEEVRAALAGR